MKVELIDYTEDGINKIANMAKATRMSSIDLKQHTGKDNTKFVKHLIKIGHLGVLEHINFTFHISEVSRCLSHQLVRHRIGFSYLQMSGRHAKPKCDSYIIPKSIDNSNEHYCDYKSIMSDCWDKYDDMIKTGIPVEDARYILPPAFFTHISFSCNTRSLRHFLKLRLDKHAQWEIREMAQKIFDIIYELYPVLFEDLKELRNG